MKNGKTRSDVASKGTQDPLTSVLLCFTLMHILNNSILFMFQKQNRERWRLCSCTVDVAHISCGGSPQLPDGSTLALPKVATAQFGSDPNKRTVCVYGHVDVQPAKLEDGWATEPYNLTDINGNSS